MALPGSSLPPRDAFQRLVEGLQTFIREHLALAGAEARQELQLLGRKLALSAAGIPFLAVGYLLLTVAAAFALALALPQWAAFGIVALANLGAGGVLTVLMARRVARQRPNLRATSQELKRDQQWVSQLPNATAGRAAVPSAPPDSGTTATPGSMTPAAANPARSAAANFATREIKNG